MGMYKKIDNNTLQKLAGYTVIADGSCAEIRKGQASFTSPEWGQDVNVTFTDPMPDANYEVLFEFPLTGQSWTAGSTPADVAIHSKTATGFSLRIWPIGTVNQVYIDWTAVRLIPMEGYTELKNKVDNPDTTPTENSTNLCTSGGIYEAIKNASSVFVGTKAEWEAEPDQTIYDIAVITDEHKVLSVDRSTGNTEEQANLNKIFRGTLAEWEALSQAEKDYYDEAHIDDGPAVETSLLEKIYCVGSVYINTVDINPATIFGFGTWQRVASNMALWGASADGQAGTTKAAGLPNITGALNASRNSSGYNSSTGCFTSDMDPAKGLFETNQDPTFNVSGSLHFDASKSNPIFGASTTVQPPALVVNIWKRTA